jgi:hypothetical protein
MFHEKLPEIRYEGMNREEVGEREDVERIENLDFLKPQERMDLILTYLGEKPTSMIEIAYDSKKPFAELKEVLSKKEELEKILSATKLAFKILEKEETDENGFDRKVFQFLVGKDEKGVQELERALVERDDRKMKRLLGYPETSIKALFEGTILDEKMWWKSLSEKEREDLLQEGVLNFITFPLSKDHWQEELKIARQRQAKIKEKTPKLYLEIIKEKPKVAMSEEERKEHEKREIEAYLEEIRKEVERLVDKLGLPVEEGIKETVVMLNAFEIRTSASCEGHFQKKGEKVKYFDGEKITEEVLQEDKVRPPWVDIDSRISDIENWRKNEALKEKIRKQNNFFQKRMKNLLRLFYRERKVPFDQRLHLRPKGIYGAFRLENQGAKILEKEKKKEKLDQYRREMIEFARFLKEIFPEFFYRRLEI